MLEALRQPLEERVVRVSRASGTLEFPADFLLVACANPCPCGRIAKDCRCGDLQQTRYARRLSAPLLDRFDLRLRIDTPGDEAGESSAQVRGRVDGRSTASAPGSRAPAGGATRTSRPARWSGSSHWLPTRVRRGSTRAGSAGSPGRGAARIRRVARTIADLDDRDTLAADDIMRAAWLREDVW